MRGIALLSRLTAGPVFAFTIFAIFALLAFGASASACPYGFDQPPRGPKAKRLMMEAAENLPEDHPPIPTHLKDTIDNAEASSEETAPANEDLICSPGNADDCYPRIFRATDVFHVVREGQEIPHGLHVRLDISTGLKEAKLNNPDEQNPVLEGLPVANSMVLVESEDGGEGVTSDQVRPPNGAPEYEPIGKIKQPETESQAFYDSLTVLKTLSLNDRPIDAALEILGDISHDIYYGLKITEDADAVKELLCMMSSQIMFARDIDDEVVKQAGSAASIIGSALQNNQKALAEVEKSWEDISKTPCAGTDRTLSQAVSSMLLPDTTATAEGTTSSSESSRLSLTKPKTAALRGLIKSPLIRDDFLNNGGTAQILRVLALERPELESAQQKLANMVMDSFLDEGMGAVLGIWPRPGDVDHDWDYQLKALAKLHNKEKGHWSAELWRMLQEQRKAMRTAEGKSQRTEL